MTDDTPTPEEEELRAFTRALFGEDRVRGFFAPPTNDDPKENQT